MERSALASEQLLRFASGKPRLGRGSAPSLTPPTRSAVCSIASRRAATPTGRNAWGQPAPYPRPVADHHGHLQSMAVWQLFIFETLPRHGSEP